MTKTIMLNVGDKIFYNNILCPITELRPTGVVIRQGTIHRFICNNDLIPRDFEYCIEFEKDGNVGLSHTVEFDKVGKEVALLEEIGFNTRVYQREVR